VTKKSLSLWVAASLLVVAGCATEGPAGPQGPEGAEGPQGPAGEDGTDGTSGADGADGQSGADGTDGADGQSGTDGADGADGQNGTDGADGADGQNGTDGADGDDGIGFESAYTGTVVLSSGPAAMVPVAFDVLDWEAGVFATLGATFTDVSGAFTINVANIAGPNTLVRIRAMTPEGTLWAFASTDTGLVVDAASTAIGTLVSWIVGTEGDTVMLSDYSPAEIVALETAARAALTAAGTDLTDPQAVIHDVLWPTGGGAIANASSGTWSAEALAIIVPPPTPGVSVPTTDSYFDWEDSVTGEFWDLDTAGTVGDGSDDAFDGAAYLYVDGDYFPELYYGTDPMAIEDDSELVLGPVPDLAGSGLDVTQRIQILHGTSAARWMIGLTNPTGAEITTTLEVWHGLGSDEDHDWASATSSGDTTVDGSDWWVANEYDSYETAVGLVAPGWTLAKSDDDLSATLTVTVPAGESVNAFYWLIQSTTGLAYSVQPIIDMLEAIDVNNIDPAWFLGATADEVADSFYSFAAPNIVASAGAFGPMENVTLTNTNTSATMDIEAGADGSLEATFAAVSGDVITAVGNEGSNETFTIP
jgi:hypothetical protein